MVGMCVWKADIKFILCCSDRPFLAIFTFHHNFVCINTIIFVLLKLFSMFFGRLLLHSAIVLNFLRENNVPKLFLFTVMYEYFDQECFFLPSFPFSIQVCSCSVVRVYKSLCAYFFSLQYKTKWWWRKSARPNSHYYMS